MTARTAAVVGLGVAGRAAAKLLHDQGYVVTAYDQGETRIPDDVAPFIADLETIGDAGDMADALLAAAPDILVVSPGVPEISPVVVKTREAGLNVVGEVEAAWRAARTRGGDLPVWLAITGTNGKTTTVGMTEAIVRAAGIDAIKTGNVGYPIASAVVEGHELLAVELSSAQLALSSSVAPWASICLNIDVDHLDWHGDADAYRAAKAAVYDRVQRARLYFADDPVVARMALDAQEAQDSIAVPLVFGDVEEGQIGVKDGVAIDRAFGAATRVGGEDVVTADLRGVPLLAASLDHDDGRHAPLVRDALAAIALARSCGVGPDAIVRGLRDFQMAPHRFALIDTLDGVTWIDDSKATNVHAAEAALRAVRPGTAVWIVGGDTKGQDLAPLIGRAAATAKAAIVIGADQTPLLEAFRRFAPETPVHSVAGAGQPTDWMREVVRACREMARPGDTVLLAPACASWDQFPSYSVRGDVFRQAVAREHREER